MLGIFLLDGTKLTWKGYIHLICNFKNVLTHSTAFLLLSTESTKAQELSFHILRQLKTFGQYSAPSLHIADLLPGIEDLGQSSSGLASCSDTRATLCCKIKSCLRTSTKGRMG